jgi:Asp-tRNA(Asn)/Glu-tRNA(Gln) amidotransferase B subunit
MDKLSKIAAFLLLTSVCEQTADDQKLVGPVVAKLLTNDVFPLAQKEDTEPHEIDEYHYGMTQLVADCALLQAHGFIEARHAKKIIKDCWSFPYVGFDLVQYARATKIFDEAGGEEILTFVREVLADPNYAKAATQVKEGKDKAIGALVGAVMKKVKGDPKQIKELLANEMGVTLPA